jgi:Rrf2 family transcriptional regulator, iron-sulfur cluster assembly transcription factor
MLFSTATGYALRALAAMPEDGNYSLAKDLASHLGLPGPYLAKILQTLAQEGILVSVRGPRGGFRLARPAHRITVGEVVGVLDGMESMSGCVMGFVNCDGADKPCPLHAAWCQVKNHLEETLAMVTIRDLQLLDLRNQRGIPRIRSFEPNAITIPLQTHTGSLGK